MLLKALLSRRVDVINSVDLYLMSSLQYLQTDLQLTKLGVSQNRSLYIGVRENLPQKYKNEILAALQRNTQQFDFDNLAELLSSYQSVGIGVNLDPRCHSAATAATQ